MARRVSAEGCLALWLLSRLVLWGRADLANDQVFDEAVSSRELFFDREEVRRGLELHVEVHEVPVHEL